MKLSKEQIFYTAVRVHVGKNLVRQMDDIESEIDSTEDAKRIIQRRKHISNQKIWASVALAACVAMFIWLSPYLSGTLRIDQFEQEYVLHTKTRSAEAISEHTKWKGYNLYTIKKYRKAIPFLKKEWEQNQDTLSLFYLGVSYVAIGKDKKAEAIFNQIKDPEQKALLQELLQ